MSRKKKYAEFAQVPMSPYTKPCICSLPQLAILILIILQFSDRGQESKKIKNDTPQIGNEILFIIALYFLSCIECSYRYPHSIINVL